MLLRTRTKSDVAKKMHLFPFIFNGTHFATAVAVVDAAGDDLSNLAQFLCFFARRSLGHAAAASHVSPWWSQTNMTQRITQLSTKQCILLCHLPETRLLHHRRTTLLGSVRCRIWCE